MNETQVVSVSLKQYEKTGETRGAVWGYAPIEFGQGAYIMEQCHKEGVSVAYQYGEVKIFCKTKKGLFQKIVFSSLKFLETPYPRVDRSSTVYKCGRELLAVYVKKSNTLYTTEGKIARVVSFMFQRIIPRAKHFDISYTKREMEERLGEIENIWVEE